jgi:hypothetical protein
VSAFSNDGQNPIFDAGNKKPLRTRTFRTEENGKPVTRTERRPQGRYLMVVDSFGNVVPLKLHNAIAETAEHDPYKLHIKYAKTRANSEWGTQPMVPVGGCPQATEFQYLLPDHLQSGNKCARAVDGQVIGEDRGGDFHYCKCIDTLIRERREANSELEAARDPKTTIMQAVLNNSQETTAHLTQLLQKLVDTGIVPTVAATPAAPAKEGAKK